jgi:hypothetical protein
MTERHVKRPVAVGAALALALGGSLLASPAMAESPAPTAGPGYEKQAKELLGSDEVQAVGRDGDGNIVVLKTKAEKESEELEAFSEEHSNVVVQEIDGSFDAYAATDVVGGAGYITAAGQPSGTVGLCSTAFTATAPDGGQAILTAGHCHVGEQDQTYLSLPSGDGAAGGSEIGLNGTGLLGEFGFSQFGMPEGEEFDLETGSIEALDIAVIEVREEGDFELLPEVTDWTTADQDDLAASTMPVNGVMDVTEDNIGDTATKSGRTTGVTSGAIDMVDGWANVSGEYVYGFGAFMTAAEGDSGGAVMIGDQAAGILSGGASVEGRDFAWAAELQNSLEQMPAGYEVNTVASSEPEPSETPSETPSATPSQTPSETPAETPSEEETVEPALNVDPQRISASDFVDEERGVSYYAEGLESGESVTFETHMNGELAKTTELTVDENGEAAAMVWGLDPESKDAYVGTYEVIVTSGETTLEGSFEVVADEDEANAGGSSEEENETGSDLPRTGAELTGLAAGGALLIVGAAAVAIAGRRFAAKK